MIFDIPVSAELRLNFLRGDISIEQDGKTQTAAYNMIIPESAVIRTGAESAAYIHQSENDTVIIISADTRIAIKDIFSSDKIGSQKSIIGKLKKDTVYMHTAVGAVRGAEEGNVVVDWADSDRKLLPPDRTDAWDNFSSGKYNEILHSLKNASDAEGKYLYASSLFLQNGSSKAGESLTLLESVCRSNAGSSLKLQAEQMIASIYFTQARYDKALEHMSKIIPLTAEKDISESSFYILASSYRALGKTDDASLYVRKLKKHYPSSVYLTEFARQ